MKTAFFLILFLCLIHFNQGEEQGGLVDPNHAAIEQESIPSINRQERSAERGRKRNGSKKSKNKKETGKSGKGSKRANKRGNRKSTKCNKKNGKKCSRRKSRKSNKSGRILKHRKSTKCNKKNGKKCNKQKRKLKTRKSTKCNKNNGKKCKKQKRKGNRKSTKCNKKNGKNCSRRNVKSRKSNKSGRQYPDTTTTTTTTTTTAVSYTCESCFKILYDYGKDYSLSRTQVNRGTRLPKLLKRSADRSNKSATVFTEIISSLIAATDNGTSCNGSTISDVLAVINGLKNCSTTVPKICNVSSVLSNSSSSCLTSLDNFGTYYKNCLFKESAGDENKACKCLAGVSRPNRASKTGDVCLPSPFDTDETAAKALNKACINTDTVGSWGYCRKQQKAAQVYLVGGSKACGTGSGSMTTTTSPGGRRLWLRNQFKGLFNNRL